MIRMTHILEFYLHTALGIPYLLVQFWWREKTGVAGPGAAVGGGPADN